ncbi:UPF0462 protein C4orf33 homolog [Ylistrum balloti]|uniref:UPF0462 protein C4orf33 homolog n=1 Tax=Ylistrum balloti TaxID=509963 RepID=UPI00290593DE|nr:UPF0462 protein C4orf33 homolog [Ylistrum balloti]
MRTTWREADDVWVCGPYNDPGGQGDVPPTGSQQHGTMANINPRRDNFQLPKQNSGPPVLYTGTPGIYTAVPSQEWIRFDLAYVDHVHHKIPGDGTWKGRRRKATVMFYLIGVLLIFFSVAVIVTFIAFFSERNNEKMKNRFDSQVMEFSIATTWDSQPVDHTPVKITLSRHVGGNDVNIHVDAPFFNDPPNPGGTAGQPFPKLYNYEVVEAFFLNDQDDYLEVELSPHGQHLVLMLRGERNAVKQQLPISYTARQHGNTWQGNAVVPGRYFPRDVTKFNAYAIHGTDPNRVYESLYPVPAGKYQAPDFHKLTYFRTIDFQSILPSNHGDGYDSAEWSSIPAHHHEG